MSDKHRSDIGGVKPSEFPSVIEAKIIYESPKRKLHLNVRVKLFTFLTFGGVLSVGALMRMHIF
jgi:hypothetical protein